MFSLLLACLITTLTVVASEPTPYETAIKRIAWYHFENSVCGEFGENIHIAASSGVRFIIAGSYPAAVELYEHDGTEQIYNDIDVFYTDSDDGQRRDYRWGECIPPDTSVARRTKEDPNGAGYSLNFGSSFGKFRNTSGGPYSFLNWDNSMAKAINSGACHDCDLCPKPVKDKKIVDVYDRDVDNLDVGVNFVKYTDYTLKVLIDSFDTNNVQVGIDVHVVGKWNATVGAPVLHVRILDTYRSEAFEKFVKQKADARTLQISAFGTPPHSLIRLLHKSNELDLPYILPESDLEKLCCKGNMTNVGERNYKKYLKLPIDSKEFIDSYFSFTKLKHECTTDKTCSRNESGRLWEARAHKKCHRWTKTCTSNCPRYW